MKCTSLAAALLLTCAGAVQGGGPVAVAAEPAPDAAPAPRPVHDWSGPYVGLGYGTVSGDLDYIPSPARELDGGTATSLFAGYLFQRGTLVYGGEVAFSKPSDTFATGFPTESVDRVLDVKAKVGIAANRTLIYGVLGYSKLDYEIPLLANSYSTSGISYGVGLDFAATERLTVGLEYLARKTDGDTFNAGQSAEIDLNTLSLRVSFSF